MSNSQSSTNSAILSPYSPQNDFIGGICQLIPHSSRMLSVVVGKPDWISFEIQLHIDRCFRFKNIIECIPPYISFSLINLLKCQTAAYIQTLLEAEGY